MLLEAQRTARVQLRGGLDAADQALTGVECVASVEEAVRRSTAESGDNAVAVALGRLGRHRQLRRSGECRDACAGEAKGTEFRRQGEVQESGAGGESLS